MLFQQIFFKILDNKIKVSLTKLTKVNWNKSKTKILAWLN